MKLDNLSGFTQTDYEKKKIIASLEVQSSEKMNRDNAMFSLMGDNADSYSQKKFLSAPHLEIQLEPAKFCPKCGRKYPDDENFCIDCAVKLKQIRDVSISDIELDPQFCVEGVCTYTDFKDILCDEFLLKIASQPFDLNEIVLKIKKDAFIRLDAAIKDNGIDFDSLSVRDKVLLFTKSFVDVEYKSYGPELGCYRFNKIYLDDRQLSVLQITTMLHELTHFLIKEILTHVLCAIWQCSKTTQIESIATFILSYSPMTSLVDEYAAHTVEGRFTLYGYQDYSSFISIEKSVKLDESEIDMLKTIGNTFANTIKGMLESFIDDDLLFEIKELFTNEIMDRPDYRYLAYENCTLLNEEGFNEAVRFILSEGFLVSMDNMDRLVSYNEMW